MTSKASSTENCLDLTATTLIYHLINILEMAKREVTLDYIRKLAHSVPARPNGVERNDSLFFFQEWLEVDRAWYREEEEHMQIIVDTAHTDKRDPEANKRRAEKLVWATEAFNEADAFFTHDFVHVDEVTRSHIDFTIAGFTWTLAQDPLFDFFRLKKNKGVEKPLEKRMTEELDVEVLRKYLDPRSSSFIEWKHLMAYVTMFLGHHSPAKKLLKNSKTVDDLAKYIPREVEIRSLMDKLCEEEIDKESFDAEIKRLCA